MTSFEDFDEEYKIAGERTKEDVVREVSTMIGAIECFNRAQEELRSLKGLAFPGMSKVQEIAMDMHLTEVSDRMKAIANLMVQARLQWYEREGVTPQDEERTTGTYRDFRAAYRRRGSE